MEAEFNHLDHATWARDLCKRGTGIFDAETNPSGDRFGDWVVSASRGILTSVSASKIALPAAAYAS
jgi:hypothetical protein